MIILGIETSCDETSVAIIEGKADAVVIKANVVASSLSMHAQTGGIIPEVAARAQLKFMLPVLQETFEKAFGYSAVDITATPPPIDAIAVTYGPGLIGPLLIGVETARTLSFAWGKPIIPVDHMMGHIYANFIRENSKLDEKIAFPVLALVVSGGHTDLILLEEHGTYRVLGGTRDDAAGEAFDKIGRLLGLPYPAGPLIEDRAKKGDVKRFRFPRPLMDTETYDFSFSGLKTAVLREVRAIEKLDKQTVNDIAAGMQIAVVDVLVKKTLRAAEEFAAASIVLSGGVAANQMLRETFQKEIEKQGIGSKLFYPPKNLCTDNAAMIATAAYFNHQEIDWRKLSANPELYYG
jgi:N6-L-threonylcarbamoyladenine synthase